MIRNTGYCKFLHCFYFWFEQLIYDEGIQSKASKIESLQYLSET